VEGLTLDELDSYLTRITPRVVLHNTFEEFYIKHQERVLRSFGSIDDLQPLAISEPDNRRTLEVIIGESSTAIVVDVKIHISNFILIMETIEEFNKQCRLHIEKMKTINLDKYTLKSEGK